MSKKRRVKNIISCDQCKSQSDCCKFGAWADLEEAKRITALGLKGEFFQLEKDKDFPSGYKMGTSYEDESCSFLDPDGLCSIHKVDYYLKPKSCRDFPYEDNEISDFAEVLCTPFIAKARKRKKKRLYKNA
jgi:Fe-S-cluster containining protein